MFNLSNLPKIVEKRLKRLGRGKRGEKGGKSGRGTKGTLKRNKIPLYFEGGALPLTKRIPMLRGKGKNKSVSSPPVIINLLNLNKFEDGLTVTIKKLCQEGLVNKKEVKKRGIKILGGGDLTKKLEIEKKIKISRAAEAKVKKIK